MIEELKKDDEVTVLYYLVAVLRGAAGLQLTNLEVLRLLTAHRSSDNFTSKHLPPFLPLCLAEVSSDKNFSVSSSHKEGFQNHRGAREVHELVSEQQNVWKMYGIGGLITEIRLHHQAACSTLSVFVAAWDPLADKYNTLCYFCGVITTMFQGNYTLESDFYIIKYDNDRSRINLAHLTVEFTKHYTHRKALRALHSKVLDK